jgi:hypothetical protein
MRKNISSRSSSFGCSYSSMGWVYKNMGDNLKQRRKGGISVLLTSLTLPLDLICGFAVLHMDFKMF